MARAQWPSALKLGNDPLVTSGRQLLEEGVAAYPHFNLFVIALVYGSAPPESPQFAAALDAMWKNLDVCAGTTVDRADPNYASYLPRETSTGTERVCWDDELAPHNFEGFFVY